MKNRTNHFVSVIFLIIYGTLTLVTVPFHYHDDGASSFGRNEQSITQHDDASHCKHRSIELHSECTICTAASQSEIFKAVSIVPDPAASSSEHRASQLFIPIHNERFSFSRRGPPVTPA